MDCRGGLSDQVESHQVETGEKRLEELPSSVRSSRSIPGLPSGKSA